MPRETAGAGYLRGFITVQAAVAGGASAQEWLTDYVPGFGLVIESVKAVVKVAGTGSGATRLFRVVKGASTVVASATIALADTTAVGLVIDLPVTVLNAPFRDDDTLTVDVTAAGTEFTALTLDFIIRYRTRPQQLS